MVILGDLDVGGLERVEGSVFEVGALDGADLFDLNLE